MALEIEHKFLVKNDSYRDLAYDSSVIIQGYLSRVPERTVRVRVCGDKGFITVKGLTAGASRSEFEYEIPYRDAVSMLELCEPPLIEKIRWLVKWDGYLWEVDEFKGKLYPLVVAEIELKYEKEAFSKPPFVGEEVTGDPRYYNSNLRNP